MITAKGVDEKIYLSIDKDTTYQKKGFYKCRDCDHVVFLKKSNCRNSHFSHFPFGRVCNQWEKDTEEHTTMKIDIYNYFKDFYWIDSIDIETPIPYNDSFIRPDIFIKTKSGDKIAIECQITKITWLDVIEKIKKYSSINIGTLFIFDKHNYIEDFFSVNTTPYDMSPTIFVMDNIHNKRFYLYNANKKNKKKYGPVICFEQVGIRIANMKDGKFYFAGSYFNKEDFRNYKISNVGRCKIVTGGEKPNFGKIVKKVEEYGCYFDKEWVIYDDEEKR
jgi:competence CoiA-like predicted nuclease